MTNTDRASAQWRTLYEAAVFETDRHKQSQRINEALHAIMDRMKGLSRSSEYGSESAALIKALNALHDLRKMADSDGQSQV